MLPPFVAVALQRALKRINYMSAGMQEQL